jgi:hypothetical protein
METKQNKSSNASWLYKLWVILRVVCLYVYYTLLQPAANYFRRLIADQKGDIRYREATVERPQPPTIKKAFIIQSIIVMLLSLIRYMIRYWWLLAILFFAWLAFDIGILPAIECIGLWFVLWVAYITRKSFIKGINQ